MNSMSWEELRRTVCEDDGEGEGAGACGARGWWSQIMPFGEEYLLHWDPSARNQLAFSIEGFLKEKGTSVILNELISLSSVACVVQSASLPLSILDKAASIDNPWAIAMEKAEQAGRMLASALLSSYHGR